MRKIILSLAIIFLTIVSNAQVSYGPKLGPNVSNLYEKGTNASDNSDARIGFIVGGFVNFPIREFYDIQADLLFSTAGALSVYPNDINLSYINLPVMIKRKLKKFYVETGIQFGMLTSAKAKNINSSVTNDIKNDLKSTNFGIVFGVGYILKNGLGFDLRWHNGISNISKTDGYKLRNESVSLGVQYHFGKKKNQEE